MPTDPPHPTPAEAPAKCPWCEDEVSPTQNHNVAWGPMNQWECACPNCGGHGSNFYDTKERAIAAWNRVALAPARLAELEEDMRDQEAVVGIALREGIPTSPSGVTESPIARVKALYEKKVAAEAALKALVEAATHYRMASEMDEEARDMLDASLAAARKVVG